jgi:hypothetical protein
MVPQQPYERIFVAATLPPAVVRTIEQVVRARPDVTEAHLVAMRASHTVAAAPALIVISQDAAAVASLERELRSVLKPHVRPKVMPFPSDHAELPWVRGLGGELKRESGGFPWWLLFLGI